MPEVKYFVTRPVDIEKDGCDLSSWKSNPNGSLFAKHAQGFPVFLTPEEVDSCDEYAESDPYSVEANQETDFHQRRVDCTLTLVQEAAQSMGESPRILDLGCGQGHITMRIQETVPGADVSGLDYSVSAIAYAADHFAGIDFAAGNAYRCPYAANYFDLVVCNNLWEHVPDPLHLLGEISRILKPGGSLIISTPSRYRLGNLLRVALGRKVQFMSTLHVTEYSVGQVYEQLRYGGYEMVRTLSRRPKGSRWLATVARIPLAALLSLTGSHHQLEGTVFYLARRVR